MSTLVSHYLTEYEFFSKFLQPKSLQPSLFLTSLQVLETGIFEQQKTNTQMYLSAPKSSFSGN